MRIRRALGVALVFLAVPPAGRLLRAQAASILPADQYQQLRFRYIGPVGNRIIAIAGVPGNPNIYYAGAASGGIFKTSDAGAHWDPIFDDQPVSSVGALAVAPSDPNVVWAGTGESFIRSNISIGNGIYKSTDAGRTWTHAGLDATGRIGRVLVDPRDPDVVFACALGHAYGPQQERGVYRTTDGGRTWNRTLFVDENTGCSDITMDPSNPRILFAGMWQLEIHTWGRVSGGPGSGLFRSTDGGATWTRLQGHGLPASPVGKIAPQIARSNPNRVYALIETGDGLPTNHGEATQIGSLWRSDDGGQNWDLVSSDRRLRGRTHYYTRFAVEPDNENEAWFLSAEFSRTIDGGKTTIDLAGRLAAQGDDHDMWIDPTNGDRLAVAHDDGLSFSVNRGRSWHQIQLPIAQIYHVATDNRIPYNVYGNRQDGPSTRGPSNSRIAKQSPDADAGPIPRGDWHAVGGGESGWAIPDPTDNNIVWATGTGFGSLGGTVERFDERTRQQREVEIWPEVTVGVPAGGVRYRFNWTFPIALSPHDHNTLYAGSQHVHRTTNGGQSWQEISPDLTLGDASHQTISGGLTPDNIGVEYAGVVFAIAESPREKGVIWAGTNDGQVQVTRDAGAHWTNVTSALPGLPPLGTVSNIEPSRFDAGTAYVTVDLHQVNNRDPFVFKTADYGKTWKSIAGDLPHSVAGYAHCVREDPVRRGMLYVGTESALYFSLDDGQHWQPLQSGLPHAPVHWMTIQEQFNDLVVATYGRGFFILDDVTPLRQLTAEATAAPAHLFEIRDAYRFNLITEPMMMPDDPTEGRNPPEGGDINFLLKAAPGKGADGAPAEDAVEVVVSDAAGKAIRTIKVGKTAAAGLNRVWWDLRTDPSTEFKLRTPPQYLKEFPLGPDGTRKLPTASPLTVRVAPGRYSVKLVVNGRDAGQPRAIVVKKDPNSTGTEADILAQSRMLGEIRDGMNQAAAAINQAESIRSQIARVLAVAPDDAEGKAVRAAAATLDGKIVAIESRLFNTTATGRGQDMLRLPSQLVEKLSHLADVVGLNDFTPTDQEAAVLAKLSKELGDARERLGGVVGAEVASFNALLAQHRLGAVATRD
ncbi:MAG TPA: hypothetical protein VL309_09615 [Vicinamibacterales bacterium]|nr:hypothetical protein [Vicinamibacterales bacterium]